MKKTVVLAMSGGVDSSVALSLLLEQGYEVKGVTMQNGFLSSEELSRAKQAAKRFNVDWEMVSIERAFSEHVIKPFIHDYQKGSTPNPCAICNQSIKFGLLFDVMQQKYPDSLYATGHYAVIAKDNGDYFIKEAQDKNKDQSYFLGTIRPDIISRLLFPIGNYIKSEIIEYAQKKGLIGTHVSESQDICFIHENDYRQFLISHGIEEKNGNVFHENGEQLGTHSGVFQYTIGQRKGLGISYSERLFVKNIDPKTNTLLLAPIQNMYTKELRACELTKFCKEEKILELSKKMLKCKVKSGRQTFDCRFQIRDDEMSVYFEEPIFAITPGQLCVIYDQKGRIMMSGTIQKEKRMESSNR